MIHPDRIEYAASVPKIGILLAYFELHPQAATNLSAQARHELGLMAKASNNEMAAKYSREIGLKEIQRVLNSYGFYDANRGGGLWVGKHYGKSDERIGDPVGNHSHAATVRQLLRFYLLLEQGKLVSPAASQTMREIFASPEIPHDNINDGERSRHAQVIIDEHSIFAKAIESNKLNEEFAKFLGSFDWHSEVTINFAGGKGGAGWNRSKRTITVHDEYIHRFNTQGALRSKQKNTPLTVRK